MSVKTEFWVNQDSKKGFFCASFKQGITNRYINWGFGTQKWISFSRIGFKMIIVKPVKKFVRVVTQKLLFGCPLRKNMG